MNTAGNVGIDQLTQMFMGNPQPLKAKVEQAQRQTPPGQLMPDLKEALALQEIQDAHQHAQNGQALQAGGPQLTVVEKLRQALRPQPQGQAQPGMPPGAPQGMPPPMAQGMPPAQPQMPMVQAAHGGSIAHLVSNLGRHYGGGGIVAFSGEDERVGSEVPEAEGMSKYTEIPQAAAELGVSTAVYKKAADVAARTGTTVPQILKQMGVDVAKTAGRGLAQVGRAAATGPGMAVGSVGAGLTHLVTDAAANNPKLREDMIATQDPDNAFGAAILAQNAQDREKKAAPTPAGINPVTGKPISAAAMAQGVAPMPRPQATRAETGQAVPRPPVKVAAAPGENIAQSGGQSVTEAPDDLSAILRKDIADTLKRKPEEERDKGAEYYKKTVGLDALLAEQEARAKAREARYKESQENRTPEWVRGLQALGGAPVRGGLGMVLAQAGRGATAARDEYAASDAKFADEQDRLRDIITKAKIEGNTGVANAGMKALEQLRMDHQNARTSGTSLISTDENIKSRKQIAADNRAARAQSERHRQEDRATAFADKADAAHRDQAMKMAMAAATKEKALPANMAKYKNVTTEELAAQMFERIYNGLKSGKMSAAPGAASPGGTPADVTALLQKYGGR